MTWFKGKRREAAITLLISAIALYDAGCGIHFAPLPAGAIVGRQYVYDYNPSVIQSGDVQQFWWCGQDFNLGDRTQLSDTIQYESINLTTHATFGPLPVLAETQGAWDSAYTCNPKVVGGSFVNPIGDGQTYTYAMYYVGTSSGYDNAIGVAFSKDGIHWKKYPDPVILPTTQNGWGVGQPVAYNHDHLGGVWLFYQNNEPFIHEVETTSTDGVHFVTQGTLTTNGLDPNNPQPSWGDMAYDTETGYWYAAYNLPLRPPSTTGNVVERGQYGVQLYRIPNASLLTGATPWQQLTTVDTNMTGYESNFIPGLLRNFYGEVNVGPYPTIQLFASISDPPPPWNAAPDIEGISAVISNWDISTAFSWVPGKSPLVALNRYVNSAGHEVTTGWVDPNGGYSLEATLGHVYESPQEGASIPFYACKEGSTGYFVSLDSACEGWHIQGSDGYGYSQPVAGMNLVALYACQAEQDHFVSKDPNCEGHGEGQLLGYVLP